MEVYQSETNLNRVDPGDIPVSRPAYQKTNAYTQSSSLEQVMTVVLFAVITLLHSLFITSGTASLGFSVLWVLVALSYGLLVLVGYDYCVLTCSDPVDDLVVNKKRNYKETDLLYCRDCQSQVHCKSHHCKRCKRCVEYFDHHCKYLNNCIGGKNYHNFLRMLIAVTAYCLTIMFSGIWVFIAATNDPQLGVLSKGGALATAIIAFLAMLAVDSLLCFHFYLIFWLKATTLEYIMNRPDSEEGDGAI
jgi:palmitoyltransferase ZDHHC1/11